MKSRPDRESQHVTLRRAEHRSWNETSARIPPKAVIMLGNHRPSPTLRPALVTRMTIRNYLKSSMSARADLASTRSGYVSAQSVTPPVAQIYRLDHNTLHTTTSIRRPGHRTILLSHRTVLRLLSSHAFGALALLKSGSLQPTVSIMVSQCHRPLQFSYLCQTWSSLPVRRSSSSSRGR